MLVLASPFLIPERFRITFTVNIRFKLAISQIRGWADKNCMSKIILTSMNMSWNYFSMFVESTEQQTTSICDVKGKLACHGAQIDVCRKLDFKVFYLLPLYVARGCLTITRRTSHNIPFVFDMLRLFYANRTQHLAENTRVFMYPSSHLDYKNGRFFICKC